MYKIYVIFPIMTLLGALGGFFFKIAADRLEFNKIKTIILNWYLYLGGVFYVTAAILNIIALKYLPYNIVLPLTAMTYIWTMAISKFALKEKINRDKIIGMVLILIGSIFIAM